MKASEKNNPGILKLCFFSVVTTVLFFLLIEGLLRLFPAAYVLVTRGISKDHSARERTILTMGDSFTFGLHVERNESYPAQLQDLLIEKNYHSVRIANVGFPSRTPNMMRRALPDYLKNNEADLIILMAGYNLNDSDILEYQEIVGLDPNHAGTLFRLRTLLLHAKTFRVLDHAVSHFRFSKEVQDKKYKNGMDLFNFVSYQKINYWAISKLVDAIQREGIPVVLMNYPEAPVPENPCTDREYYYWVFRRANNCTRIKEGDYLFPTGKFNEIAINSILRHVSQTEGIPLVDNLESFRDLPDIDKYFVPSNNHPSREGYAIVAGNALKKLEEIGFLEPEAK